MNTLIFCLGAISVLVLVLLVAMIVMTVSMLKLNKKANHQESVQIGLQRNIDEHVLRVTRDLERFIEDTGRNFDEADRIRALNVQEAQTASKSYTDSRIDKLSDRSK